MAGINKAIIVGRLGKDPETRYTGEGKAVTNFSIATSEEWKDKNTGEKKENTEWHRIVAWDRLAEICDQFLHKGSMVYVEGKIQTRQWQDNDGNTKYTTEIIAKIMQMLDSKNAGGDNRAQSGQSGQSRQGYQSQGGGQQQQGHQGGQGGAMNDDIPF